MTEFFVEEVRDIDGQTVGFMTNCILSADERQRMALLTSNTLALIAEREKLKRQLAAAREALTDIVDFLPDQDAPDDPYIQIASFAKCRARAAFVQMQNER